jgi:hypothetical protein
MYLSIQALVTAPPSGRPMEWTRATPSSFISRATPSKYSW